MLLWVSCRSHPQPPPAFKPGASGPAPERYLGARVRIIIGYAAGEPHLKRRLMQVTVAVSLMLCVGTVALWSWSFYRAVPIAPGPHAEADGKFDAFVSEGELVTGYALERERFYSTHAIPLLLIAASFAVGPLAWWLLCIASKRLGRRHTPGTCSDCG